MITKIIAGTVALASLSGVALAQDTTISGVKEKRAEAREMRKEQREEKHADYKAHRAEAKENRAELQGARKAVHEEMKAEAEAKKAEYKEALENAETEEEKAAIREEIATEKKAMKAKREEARSEHKAKVRVLVGERSHFVAEQFANHQTKATQIMSRVESKLADLSARGVDTTDAQALVDEAKVAVAAVSGTVADAVASLESVVDIEDSQEARDAVQEAKTELKAAKTELKAAYALVKEAVGVVKESVRATKEAEDNEEEA